MSQKAHDDALARMKLMLVGFFSHEIRTPLNSVSMGLQILYYETAQNNNGGKCLKLIKEVKQCCAQAVGILDKLVMYERMEAKQFLISKSHIEVSPLLDEIVGPYLSTTDGKNELHPRVTLTRNEVSGYTVSINADKEKLVLAVSSVLARAVQSVVHSGTVSCSTEITTDFPLSSVSQSDDSKHDYLDYRSVYCIKIVDTGPLLSTVSINSNINEI